MRKRQAPHLPYDLYEGILVKIKGALNILERYGYKCGNVKAKELYTYVNGRTPTGDTIGIQDVLENEYYLIHEIVEICELKKLGVAMEEDTVIKHYPEVYRAHIKALDLELTHALKKNDHKWLESRLKIITSQLNFDIGILEKYLEPKEVGRIKVMMNSLVEKYAKSVKGD